MDIVVIPKNVMLVRKLGLVHLSQDCHILYYKSNLQRFRINAGENIQRPRILKQCGMVTFVQIIQFLEMQYRKKNPIKFNGILH